MAACLRQIGVQVSDLAQCATLDDEFKVLKKAYYKKILRSVSWPPLLPHAIFFTSHLQRLPLRCFHSSAVI